MDHSTRRGPQQNRDRVCPCSSRSSWEQIQILWYIFYTTKHLDCIIVFLVQAFQARDLQPLARVHPVPQGPRIGSMGGWRLSGPRRGQEFPYSRTNHSAPGKRRMEGRTPCARADRVRPSTKELCTGPDGTSPSIKRLKIHEDPGCGLCVFCASSWPTKTAAPFLVSSLRHCASVCNMRHFAI
ncbi:hypothetical protein PDESU_06544 [Pontiella desulfatans]|uniref:Uncharacterized protein n=1 Tax=Pontiella desulfatans TaxID=2750659 RepID=A0A6C2UCM4_PONDE|nr:hypothetical protein PDESU_06544 [Pontiella desulfatans]